MTLYKRRVFDEIEPYLGDETVLVLHGARQVGKTHILYYIRDYLTNLEKKVFFYDLEFPKLLEMLNQGTDSFVTDLKGKNYLENEEIFVLIDEIQYLENPSSFLKIIADHYKNIHLIVSGSSSFDIKSKFSDSLVGRYIAFEVFPLSFEEFLKFKQEKFVLSVTQSSAGVFRLKELYNEFVTYGGYPKVVLESLEEKKKTYLYQVVDTYIRKDVRDLAKIDDIDKFNKLLSILASQSGNLLDKKSLSSLIGISYPTLEKYLMILEETYVIKLVTPFSKSLKIELIKNPKIFLYDSGLLSILWFKEFQHTLLGSIFETNIFGELVKKYGRNNINFWRTKTHQEVDFIVEKNNKLWPLEVKINFESFESRSIRKFADKYQIEKWNIVGLKGEKKDNCLYPWEI